MLTLLGDLLSQHERFDYGESVAHPVDLFSAQQLYRLTKENVQHQKHTLKRKIDGFGIMGNQRPLKESCRGIGFLDAMPPVNLPPRFFYSGAPQSHPKKSTPKPSSSSSQSQVTCTSCVRSKVSVLFWKIYLTSSDFDFNLRLNVK